MIYRILLLGFCTADPEVLQAAMGVILCFVFCLRPDSLVFVKQGNLSLREDGLHILAGCKTIDLLDIKEITLPWPELQAGGPDVHRPSPHLLRQSYLACFTAERRAGDFALRLAGDTRGRQASRKED